MTGYATEWWVPYAAVNEVSLYFEEHGQGEPIVFVHGAGGNHLSWWQQVACFAATHRCITFDVRGFGRSSAPTSDARASLPDDLVGLLDVLGLPPAVLVAQSAGGIPALGVAVARSDRVRGLVLSGSIGTVDDAPLRARIAAHRAAVSPAEVDSYSAAWAGAHPNLAFLYEQIRHLNPPLTERVALEPEERFVATRERLSRLTVPTQFVAGALDRLVPADVLRDVAALMPRATCAVISGCGHSSYFEDADQFNRVVGGFIDSLP